MSNKANSVSVRRERSEEMAKEIPEYIDETEVSVGGDLLFVIDRHIRGYSVYWQANSPKTVLSLLRLLNKQSISLQAPAIMWLESRQENEKCTYGDVLRESRGNPNFKTDCTFLRIDTQGYAIIWAKPSECCGVIADRPKIEMIQKFFRATTGKKPCSGAAKVLKDSLERYAEKLEGGEK